ncbi:hypothetical protein OJAV_G00126100 [Oryzias javanicus]|uniref:Uncharacterized protein n=1 Tax=Oryzias javanicus TaxID=123683 RepID=A0A437CPX8_ORYJA|nr:hypothetical protein OJAV_G00126100 [Oryzias javanicus]
MSGAPPYTSLQVSVCRQTHADKCLINYPDGTTVGTKAALNKVPAFHSPAPSASSLQNLPALPSELRGALQDGYHAPRLKEENILTRKLQKKSRQAKMIRQENQDEQSSSDEHLSQVCSVKQQDVSESFTLWKNGRGRGQDAGTGTCTGAKVTLPACSERTGEQGMPLVQWEPPAVSTALLLHRPAAAALQCEPINPSAAEQDFPLDSAVSSHHFCSQLLSTNVDSESKEIYNEVSCPRFNKNHRHPCAGGQHRGLPADLELQPEEAVHPLPSM